MAFWMDPFIMLGCGMAIAWIAKRFAGGSAHFVYAASALTILVTYAISIGLYVNLPIMEPIWTLLGAESGTEYMFNGIILGLVEPGVVPAELGRLELAGSIFVFTTYPFWLALGVVFGRLSFGRHPAQEGAIGLLRV